MAIPLASSIGNPQEWLQFVVAACACGLVFWRTGLGAIPQSYAARFDHARSVRRAGKLLRWPNRSTPIREG